MPRSTRSQKKSSLGKSFKKQPIVPRNIVPTVDSENEEEVTLEQDMCLSEVEEETTSSVDEKQELENEPEWTATSRKRKAIFQQSQAHLQPLALNSSFSTPRGSSSSSSSVMPPAPKKFRSSKSSSNKKNFAINWTERKHQLAESDNIAFIDPLIETLLSIFQDVAYELRNGDLSKVGPVFLWELMPSFMKAIEETPWGYWFDIQKEGMKGVDDQFVVFINWPYGASPMSLTPSQKKFRQVCIGKVATHLEESLRDYFSNPSITVRWSKAFGNNESS